jgi:hypothetical protein
LKTQRAESGGHLIQRGTKMNDSAARVLGGIYIALCSALSDQSVDLANDILFRFADDPETAPSDARVYRVIAECAGRRRSQRPHLELITGGAA